MKILYVSLLAMILGNLTASGQQQKDRKEILQLIEKYSAAVISRDSATFYELFNNGQVTWAGSLSQRSQDKEIESGKSTSSSAYFMGSYQQFMRGLFKYSSTEDKFDNIQITTDGTVASVTMDYSFWANRKMTNWGGKYLGLIKKEGRWKITSVIYSLDLTKYFKRTAVASRKN